MQIHDDSFNSDWLDEINNPLHVRIFTFSYLQLFYYVCLSLSCAQSLASWPYLNTAQLIFQTLLHPLNDKFFYKLSCSFKSLQVDSTFCHLSILF